MFWITKKLKKEENELRKLMRDRLRDEENLLRNGMIQGIAKEHDELKESVKQREDVINNHFKNLEDIREVCVKEQNKLLKRLDNINSNPDFQDVYTKIYSDSFSKAFDVVWDLVKDQIKHFNDIARKDGRDEGLHVANQNADNKIARLLATGNSEMSMARLALSYDKYHGELLAAERSNDLPKMSYLKGRCETIREILDEKI